jgi:hypothetical protein
VTTEIAMIVSGFLFLLILVLYLVMSVFGYKIGLGPYDSDAELQKINNHPNKFKIAIVLALIDHVSIIALAILLFIVFGTYSLILGVVWIVFRTGEGLGQIYNEKKYWELLNIARRYSVISGAEKKSLSDSARTILNTRDSRFIFTQFLWSIGTLAFSIVLVTYVIVPLFIGWSGIVAGILGFLGNGIKLIKADFKAFKVLLFMGFLPAILFEVSIGVWLIFVHTIP